MKSKIRNFFLVLSVLVVGFTTYLTFGERRPAPKMTWGVAFNKSYAESLGVPWRAAYVAVLDELGVSHLRLGSYWSETEPQPGKYDFSDLDLMVDLAKLRGRKVVLTLGIRQPRWPECHVPGWASGYSYEAQEPYILKHIDQVVRRYRDNPAVIGWQVENEYFVEWFGNCPLGNPDYLQGEINLVRELDPKHPILITDSGELSSWLQAYKYGDEFGTTMYRKVRGPLGPTVWPLPPVYYSRKGRLVSLLRDPKRMIIAELQMEPWGVRGLREDTTQQAYETFDPEQFRKNIEFARNSGMDTAYLWGVEWWYYMKQVRAIPDFWNLGKSLWKNQVP